MRLGGGSFNAECSEYVNGPCSHLADDDFDGKSQIGVQALAGVGSGAEHTADQLAVVLVACKKPGQVVDRGGVTADRYGQCRRHVLIRLDGGADRPTQDPHVPRECIDVRRRLDIAVDRRKLVPADRG